MHFQNLRNTIIVLAAAVEWVCFEIFFFLLIRFLLTISGATCLLLLQALSQASGDNSETDESSPDGKTETSGIGEEKGEHGKWVGKCEFRNILTLPLLQMNPPTFSCDLHSL